jgi:hypothetical protein
MQIISSSFTRISARNEKYKYLHIIR